MGLKKYEIFSFLKSNSSRIDKSLKKIFKDVIFDKEKSHWSFKFNGYQITIKLEEESDEFSSNKYIGLYVNTMLVLNDKLSNIEKNPIGSVRLGIDTYNNRINRESKKERIINDMRSEINIDDMNLIFSDLIDLSYIDPINIKYRYSGNVGHVICWFKSKIRPEDFKSKSNFYSILDTAINQIRSSYKRDVLISIDGNTYTISIPIHL